VDIPIKKMPKTALSARDQLPESPGLYFLIDNAGRVYYLAACDNIKSDVIYNSFLDDFLASKAEYIHYFLWEDMDDLSVWEGEYLAKLDPPLNRGSNELPITNLGYSETQFIARYKEINLMIAELEKERDEIKPNLVSLIENNGDTIKSNGITVYLNRRTTYEYSTRVENLNKQLKDLKKEEEKTGVAVPKSVVVFPIVR
jgi:hypothetical protein